MTADSRQSSLLSHLKRGEPTNRSIINIGISGIGSYTTHTLITIDTFLQLFFTPPLDLLKSLNNEHQSGHLCF